MTIELIRQKLLTIVSKTNSLDGIILAVGMGGLVVGILVDVFIIRLLCLILVVSVAVLIVLAMRSKQFDHAGAGEGAHPPPDSQADSAVKKIVFDDFQSFSQGRFETDRAHEHDHGIERPTDAARGDRMAAGPSSHPTQQKQEPHIADRKFEISDFFDVDSAIYKGDSEPRTEFDFLLNKVLTLIKEILFAHSVAFFWANQEKRQMVLEARVSDSPLFMKVRRFPMGHDLLSKVGCTGTPEVVTDINPMSESELFRYYDAPASVKSFAGVPVFFSKTADAGSMERPVAVIAVDSKVEDQFGHETLVLLGQYTKLVSALIKSYNEKYDLLINAELLRSIRRLQEKIRNSFTIPTILQSVAEETTKLVNWDFLSIVLYDESKHAWLAKKVSNRGYQEGYIGTEQAIDFPRSVVGEVIKQNTHRIIDDLEHHRQPRYVEGEKLPRLGSFVSVPISSLNKCYGALSLESREKLNFSRQDIEILYRLTENVASALEILFMQEVIDEYVIVDEVTGVYSKKFFTERMEEELQRSEEYGTELSMLFITVDKASDVVSRFGKDGFERVMCNLATAIRSSVRPYEIVGRYDQHRFAVLLINTPANDAYLWAEKIRKNVASHVIALEGKNFSITISTGVCGVMDGMNKEELLGNTIAVLNKAAEAGGNAVRVF